jgi:AraC family transcriptional regulator, arabinose operon regulatory protein
MVAYGALSAVMKDNYYWFGTQGFIFTSPWVVTANTARHAAVILLTASGEPVEVTVEGRVIRREALAVAPLTPRGLRAMDVGLLSLHVFPPHPCYRAFQAIPAPGVLALDRARFAGLGVDIVRAYEGRLTLAEAQRLFDRIVEAALVQLPHSPLVDCRQDRLHAMLRENPGCSLSALARELQMSYTGASHYFARSVGLPLRSYQLWLKYFTAADLRLGGGSLTRIAHAAGFTDSSHLSHTWQASYGLPPSYTMDDRHVRTFSGARAVDAGAAARNAV